MAERTLDVFEKVLNPAKRPERPRLGPEEAALLVVESLRKDFPTPRGPLPVLEGISLTLAPASRSASWAPRAVARARS